MSKIAKVNDKSGTKKNGKFDIHGRKIPSPHSPLWEGKRHAGPPGGRPRWAASLARSLADADHRRYVVDLAA
jgi:hypothetical protein